MRDFNAGNEKETDFKTHFCVGKCYGGQENAENWNLQCVSEQCVRKGVADK